MAEPLLPRVRAEVEARFEPYVDILRQMVNIDCGTYTPAGVNRIAELCQARFDSMGFDAERRPHRRADDEQQLGDCLIGRSPVGSGPRVLLIGHMDTVFSEGTASARA